MSFTTWSAGSFTSIGFCLTFAPCEGYDERVTKAVTDSPQSNPSHEPIKQFIGKGVDVDLHIAS
jgi:hypothetical protein